MDTIAHWKPNRHSRLPAPCVVKPGRGRNNDPVQKFRAAHVMHSLEVSDNTQSLQQWDNKQQICVLILSVCPTPTGSKQDERGILEHYGQKWLQICLMLLQDDSWQQWEYWCFYGDRLWIGTDLNTEPTVECLIHIIDTRWDQQAFLTLINQRTLQL